MSWKSEALEDNCDNSLNRDMQIEFEGFHVGLYKRRFVTTKTQSNKGNDTL